MRAANGGTFAIRSAKAATGIPQAAPAARAASTEPTQWVPTSSVRTGVAPSW
jgi:hypothetical protein